MNNIFKPKRLVPMTIAEHVDDTMRVLKELFPGSKLTLVIRSGVLKDPVIFTNDQPEEIIKSVKFHAERSAKGLNVRQ